MGIDYYREKYGLVALANYLTRDKYEEVLLSVRPDTLHTKLEGVAVPVLDPVLDATDEKYKHNFYIDRGGRIDLVARKDGRLVLVEAKGTSIKPDAGLDQPEDTRTGLGNGEMPHVEGPSRSVSGVG